VTTDYVFVANPKSVTSSSVVIGQGRDRNDVVTLYRL